VLYANDMEVRHAISREAIIGHDTAWKISDLGAIQFEHGYDEELLKTIERKALELKEQYAIQKHLDLTFITGADRYIPEIAELHQNKKRMKRISQLAGTELEPYPFSIVSTTVTFMGPEDIDGVVDWHCDGVPVTELVPLSISDPIIGGELEIYMDNCEIGRSALDKGETLPAEKMMIMPHKVGYSTLGQLMGVLHRTVPIQFGSRVTLVMNYRSVKEPHKDDNRIYYLAADNDDDKTWINEIAEDVWERQLPAYRKMEMDRVGHRQKSQVKSEQVRGSL